MNTNPDDEELALWLDDALDGPRNAEVEAWAATEPDQLAARATNRKISALLSENIEKSESPPYPDFFNHKIEQRIRSLSKKQVAGVEKKPVASSFWRTWLMPVAACAGMVLAFGIGTKSRVADLAEKPNTVDERLLAPVVYTPEKGVDADWFASDQAEATVIVLRGIDAIPDSMDFSETVYVPRAGDVDRTAGSGKEKSGGLAQ